MKNKSHSGFIILIIVFAAVCLFTFVSIVLVSAKQSQTQSDMITKRQTDYYTACNHANEHIAKTIESDGIYEKTFIINDDEVLYVAYTVKDKSYEITKWQTVNIADWTPDNHINLLK